MTYHVFAVSDNEAHIVDSDDSPYLSSCVVLKEPLDFDNRVVPTYAAMLARILNADMNEEDLCDAIALFQERKNRFEDCPF